jgi:hypothetical protein
MKVCSVLTYPYENKLVVVVTRSEGYFTFPHTKKTYSADYDSKFVLSLHKWSKKLHALHNEKLFNTMRDNFLEKKRNGD